CAMGEPRTASRVRSVTVTGSLVRLAPVLELRHRGVVTGEGRVELGLARGEVDGNEVDPVPIRRVHRRVDRGVAGCADRAYRQTGVKVRVVRVVVCALLSGRPDRALRLGAVVRGRVELELHALVEAVVYDARDLVEVALESRLALRE